MREVLVRPWPWYVVGPLLGLMVPALLVLGNRQFGFSSNLRHLCAALLPRDIAFFKYDWKTTGGWNLVFLVGTTLGGFIGGKLLATPDVAMAARTRDALSALGIHDLSGPVPAALFSWSGLMSLPGLVLVVVGGFLVGFGTAYAGGCTSGHAISGLADLQRASLVAVVGFFAGGLLATYVVLPLLLGGRT